MGENGAGKSTLMKCLFGIYKKDGGSIRIDGKEVNFSGPKDALDHGVAMVHQELNQVMHQNVMENIWLGRYPVRNGFIDEKKMYDDTKEALRKLELDINPHIRMKDIPVSKRQMLEICRAVSCQARILVLDEPTRGIDVGSKYEIYELILALAAEGKGILMVSSEMPELIGVCDRILVMSGGSGRHQCRKDDHRRIYVCGRDVWDRCFPRRGQNTVCRHGYRRQL